MALNLTKILIFYLKRNKLVVLILVLLSKIKLTIMALKVEPLLFKCRYIFSREVLVDETTLEYM